MSEALTFTVAPTRVAPVEGIQFAGPHGVASAAKCEMNVNLGIFFDGTSNNRDADTPSFKHTNIVRLWEAYKDQRTWGYAPAALGVSVGKDKFESDALKLAQVPLNHMFECAKNAGVPLKKKTSAEADEHAFDAFAIAPALQAAYDDFLDLATMQARPVKDWLQPYLNWRWDRRLVHASLGHVRKANEVDRALLIKHHQHFLSDLACLERKAKPALLKMLSRSDDGASAEQPEQDKESVAILQIAQQTAPDECMRFHQFFDGFVHDSLAGFDMRAVEPSGHWRYRKGFLGSDRVLTVDAQGASKAGRAA